MTTRRRRWSPVLLLLVLPLMGTAGEAADSWLTPTEKGFFDSLGFDVALDGKPYRQNETLGRLPGLLAKADQPIRTSIEAYRDGRRKMMLTLQDKQDYLRIRQVAQAELGLQMGFAVFGMLLGDNPWDATIAVADGMLRHGRVVDMWKLQAKWLERAIEGRTESYQALAEITDGLERRLGPKDAPEKLPFRVDFKDRRLVVVGTIEDVSLAQPVFQVVLHKFPVGGEWALANIASASLVRALGVEGMNFDAAFHGGYLAGVQEKAANQPLLMTCVVPEVKPGATLSLVPELDPSEILSVARVELRVWSRDFWTTVDNLDGLGEAKTKAIVAAEKERRRKVDRARALVAAQRKKANNAAATEWMLQFQGNYIRDVQMHNERQINADFSNFLRRLRGG